MQLITARSTYASNFFFRYYKKRIEIESSVIR